MGKGAQVPVNLYSMSIQYGLCVGADWLTGIYSQEKTVWEGQLSVNGSIFVNQPNLFGGPKQQGGPVGLAQVFFGTDTQLMPQSYCDSLNRNAGSSINPVLNLTGGITTGLPTTWTPSTTPAYRGVVTVFFDGEGTGTNRSGFDGFLAELFGFFGGNSAVPATWGFQWSFNAPDVPAISMRVTRFPQSSALNVAYKTIAAQGAAANRPVASGWNENLYDSLNNPIPQTGTPGVTTYGPSIPDVNPAHIVFELLTNTDWGMGVPTGAINTASFDAAALTLFNENLGMSIRWSQQTSIEDLTRDILGTINGTLYVDPTTGLFNIRLLRADYDPTTLQIADETNCTILGFARKTLGETTNQILVQYTNPLTENLETVTILDPGNIAAQGGVVSQTNSYNGVRNEVLAAQLGARDIRVAAAPLATLDVTLDRTFYGVVPGQCIKINSTEYGLVGLIGRVGKVDYGKPGDAKIKVNLVEDVFSLPSVAYVIAPSSQWQPPNLAPQAVSNDLVMTDNYWTVSNMNDGGAALARTYPEASVSVLAATPSAYATGYELVGDVTDILGNTTATDITTMDFALAGSLGGALNQEASTTAFVFGPLVGNGAPAISDIIVLGTSDANCEYAIVESLALVGGVVQATLRRGVLDTTPKAWAALTRFFVVKPANKLYDTTARIVGSPVTYQFSTIMPSGRLKLSSAPTVTYTPIVRQFAPSRPANVTVGGTAFGLYSQTTTADVTVNWSRRNRLTENYAILRWTDGDTTPEAGQTTTIQIWSDDLSTLIFSIPSLTGTSYTIPFADFGGAAFAWVKVLAVNGSYTSIQGHMVRVSLPPVGGYGRLYGYRYGEV